MGRNVTIKIAQLGARPNRAIFWGRRRLGLDGGWLGFGQFLAALLAVGAGAVIAHVALWATALRTRLLILAVVKVQQLRHLRLHDQKMALLLGKGAIAALAVEDLSMQVEAARFDLYAVLELRHKKAVIKSMPLFETKHFLKPRLGDLRLAL
jgi:hypothetical protein